MHMYRYVMRSSAALLQEPKYYVSKTHCIVNAFQHHNNLHTSCEYSRKFQPWIISDLKHASSHERWEELNVTLYYMKLFGIDNVRGAAWKTLSLRPCEKKTLVAILALK